MVDKLQNGVSVSQVVEGQRLGEQVLTNTPHLDSVRREELAAIDEGPSLESDGVVSFVHHEHADKTFVAIHNEVAAQLVHVFLVGDELVFRKASQVAELGADHYRDVSQTQMNFFFRFVVNFSADRRV